MTMNTARSKFCKIICLCDQIEVVGNIVRPPLILYYQNTTVMYFYKVTRFRRATFTFSSVQPPFDINFPRSFGVIMKLAFGSPLGNFFTTGFVHSQHTASMNIKLVQTPPC